VFEAAPARLTIVLAPWGDTRMLARVGEWSRISEAEALAAEALTMESEIQVGELVGRRMTEPAPRRDLGRGGPLTPS
jgi:hypothetical protein